MIGRLDPASGASEARDHADAGLAALRHQDRRRGEPRVACNGSNCLVRVDPKTMALTAIELPIPETTVRRLDIADDGMIWYVNSSQGRQPLQSGDGCHHRVALAEQADSHPYALAVVDGIVWYNRSGKRPDALVRFDPRTELWSWPIPSGGVYAGIIRHMRPTQDGDL